MRVRNYRPTREEINAAHRAYSILYAPLPKEKENGAMASNTSKKQTEAATETGIAKRESTELSAVAGGLALDLPADLQKEFASVLTEVEAGFGGTTAARDVFARCEAGEYFYIIDAYQTTMEEDGEVKNKNVFFLEMSGGDVVKVMQGGGSIRDKYASLFVLAKLGGRGVRCGPMRYIKASTQVKRPEQAIIFQTLPGFRAVPTELRMAANV